MITPFPKNIQYYKFCFYGFLKNLRFFDAFIILFFRECGLSFLQIGALYSIREITVQIFEIPSGMAADSWGRRKAMLLALSAYIISFFIFYISNTFGLFVFAMILFAIGEAFRSGTHKAMILDYLNQNNLQDFKTQYYGQTRSWSQMGSAMAALGGMAIVFGSGIYQMIFLISIIPYLLNLILIWTYPAKLDGQNQGGLKTNIIDNFKQTLHDTKISFKKISLIRDVFSSSVLIAVFKSLKDYIQLMIASLAVGLPLLLSIKGITGTQREAVLIGTLYFFIFILTSLSARNAYRLEQKLNNLSLAANVIYLFAGISIIFSGILFKSEYYSLAIVTFLGLYIAQNLRRPLMLSYLSEKIPDKIMATGLSVESQLKTIIIAIFSPILGWLIDEYSLGTGILCGGLFLLIVYPFIRLSKVENNDR